MLETILGGLIVLAIAGIWKDTNQPFAKKLITWSAYLYPKALRAEKYEQYLADFEAVNGNARRWWMVLGCLWVGAGALCFRAIKRLNHQNNDIRVLNLKIAMAFLAPAWLGVLIGFLLEDLWPFNVDGLDSIHLVVIAIVVCLIMFFIIAPKVKRWKKLRRRLKRYSK